LVDFFFFSFFLIFLLGEVHGLEGEFGRLFSVAGLHLGITAEEGLPPKQ